MHWRLENLINRLTSLDDSFRQLRWSIRSARFPRDERGFLKLHIGCGDIAAAGFVNIDARRMSHIHIVSSNLFELRALPRKVAALVYMCHVLEHVPRAHVWKVLGEMKRVLVPGGTLRLSVPDFDLLLQIYEENERSADSIVGPLMGGQDYTFNFHYNIFTRASLTGALERAGFINVRLWSPDRCADHDFIDHSSTLIDIEGRTYPVSLNIEADVPGLKNPT